MKLSELKLVRTDKEIKARLDLGIYNKTFGAHKAWILMSFFKENYKDESEFEKPTDEKLREIFIGRLERLKEKSEDERGTSTLIAHDQICDLLWLFGLKELPDYASTEEAYIQAVNLQKKIEDYDECKRKKENSPEAIIKSRIDEYKKQQEDIKKKLDTFMKKAKTVEDAISISNDLEPERKHFGNISLMMCELKWVLAVLKKFKEAEK